MKKNNCPCGSEKNYIQCCGKFIEGKATPTTPEELMRSRYTAYTKANVKYIASTMRDKALAGFNAKDAKEWAKKANWLGLEVVSAPQAVLNKGYVEFIARYYLEKKVQSIHEKSEFHLIDGIWYYVGGTHL